MVKETHGSTKRIQISKANKKIVIATSIATFAFIFSAVAANALVGQSFYQDKVIGERKDALKDAKASLESAQGLEDSYNEFVNKPVNIIGGNPNGTSDRDGDNAKIILDALPARYDFPALASSIEKIVNTHGLTFNSMTGSDDAVAQQENATSVSPAPIEMPFEFTVVGSYEAVQALARDLERSIRPFQITMFDVTASGEGGELTVKITGHTYFQPKKALNIKEEVVQP